MKLPDGKSRLDLVREGLLGGVGFKKRGRLVVGIEKLREDPRNGRRTFRNMEGLVASIQTVGLIEPITVTPEQGSSDLYRIITGHRRYRAAKAAGLVQVEVLIREPEDELSRRVKSIISNVQREDVGPVEMAEALQALLDEDQRVKTQDDLAKLIGKDKTWVSGMLRILSLPTPLQTKVGSTQQSLSYDSMIRVARLDSPAEQAQLIEQLLSGASQKEIRQQINHLKGKPTEAALKPKKVFHTVHKATVIVQSENAHLPADRVLLALHDAIAQARKDAA